MIEDLNQTNEITTVSKSGLLGRIRLGYVDPFATDGTPTFSLF